ncbi:ATP-grasp domain-containing protein [Marinobacter halodurans]|uniref:ATP-grasp domain-containing protein n=1 Tax=Marinobacter halodurans TaxID=2528979 RepID=A0ABY1ZHY4_9GAMM|nr:ATP-grasp domain-containing protein [Marinobacter halodurans]TBW49360.1 ATP-grasp domain-containing protein [Marinobacter halodurans]
MRSERKHIAVVLQNVKLPFIFEEAEALGLELTFFYNSEDPAPGGLPGVIKCVPIPIFSDASAAFQIMKAEHEQRRFDGIVTLSEPSLNFVAHVAQSLGLRFLSPETVENCRDKRSIRRTLDSNGLNTPGYIYHDGTRELDLGSLSFPLVVKPTNGFSSQGIIRVDDRDSLLEAVKNVQDINERELSRIARDKPGIIIEEFIDGPEYVAETLSINGAVFVLSIGDKGDCKGPYFEEGIYIAPARIGDQQRQRISQEVIAAVKAMGITDGPAHTELRVNADGKPYVIETAPRVGGQGISHYIVKETTGVNLLKLVFLNALGELRESDLPNPVVPSKTAGNYIIPVRGSGVFQKIDCERNILDDASVNRVMQFFERGKLVRPYPHFSGYPGFILTSHDNHQQCEDFYKALDENLVIEYD